MSQSQKGLRVVRIDGDGYVKELRGLGRILRGVVRMGHSPILFFGEDQVPALRKNLRLAIAEMGTLPTLHKGTALG